MNNIVNPKKPFVSKKFMHPRNIYREKTDFTKLAIDYPEFRTIAKQNLQGFMSIDFKDEKSLRILNKVYLKKDFDLDVNLPEGYLVPTVSLRLNYILWIEDILNKLPSSDTVRGIDIGTGASCVYMLLGAKKNNWHMVGTDIDPEGVKHAQNNIDANKLGHLLKVILTSEEEPLFKFLAEDSQQYDFCMCNPPFFSNFDELSKKGRKLDRPEPKNVQTGKHSELVTEGGENEFIARIIKESIELKTLVKVYTTMVGHKKFLPALINLVKEAGVKSYGQTEFYQGHTSRWGLAWTFCDDIQLDNIGTEVKHYDKSKKKSKSEKNLQRPLIYTFTNPAKYPKSEMFYSNLRGFFRDLQLKFTEDIKQGQATFDITAYEITWTHQRQKRRHFKQEMSTSSNIGKRPNDSNGPDAKKIKIEDSIDTQGNNSNTPELKMDDGSLLKFKMIVELINLNQYQLSLFYMGGELKKDAMNQILTILKNRLEI